MRQAAGTVEWSGVQTPSPELLDKVLVLVKVLS